MSTLGRWLHPSILAWLLLVSPVAADIYQWTDADGRVHFSDRPQPGAESVELEANVIQVPTPRGEADAEPSEAVLRARAKRREIQRWVDRQPSRPARPAARPSASPMPRGRPQPVIPTLGGGYTVPTRAADADRREADCRRVYAKSCDELKRWKATARSDCERRNLSRDCDSAEYLDKQRPRTRAQQERIDAKRQKRRDRRDRRIEREIDALRHR